MARLRRSRLRPGRSRRPRPPRTGATSQPVEENGDEEEIVVTGQRARGSVVGDIPPEKTLNARDVRATGATNITELLDALAPQIGSSRGRGGGRPVLLLNGQRISGFRELRDIPTEAIQRVEILPEEVALKYGYRADQKRREHRPSPALPLDRRAARRQHRDRGRLRRRQRRPHPADDPAQRPHDQFNLHAEGNGMLTEDERDIRISAPPPGATVDQALAARSLIGTRRDVRGSATFNRQMFGNVSATLNTELEHIEGRSLIGLGDTLLEPLARNTSSDSAHAGVTLNWDKAQWHWNVDRQRRPATATLTRTERDDAGFPHDRARETHTSGDLTGDRQRQRCSSFRPAMPATTLQLGGQPQHLDSNRRSASDVNSTSLGRTTGTRVDQPRPADLAPQPRFQRARQSHAQRQRRGRPAVGLRHADDDRRGR